MSAREVREQALRLDAKNRRDLNVGFLVITVLHGIGLVGLLAMPEAPTGFRVTVAVVLIGVLIAAWFKRPVRLAADAEMTQCLEFYRRQLQQRRDYYARPPWFLLAAIVVALLLFVYIAAGMHAAWRDVLLFPAAVFTCGGIALVLWRREARKFQHDLDALQTFEKSEL